MIWPVDITKYKVTQGFGGNPDMYKKFGLLGHDGIDIGCPTGTKVTAPHSGKVTAASSDPNGYGLFIKIENNVEGSILAHNKSLLVKLGDSVFEGQEIAVSNNTGNSTGSHLHWGYFRQPRNKNNGYSGCVDQIPYINNSSPINTMIPENISKKSSAFDKLVHLFFTWGKFDKDNSDIYSYEDVAQIITDLKKDRDNQADRATRWDKLCNYLGFQDSVSTSYEQVQSSIAGIKSQITTLQNKVVPLEAELINKEDQVSRLKSELLESNKFRADLVKKLGEAMSAVPTTVKVYEDKIKGLQNIIDSKSKEIGLLKTDLTKCKSNNETAKKNLINKVIDFINMIWK